MADPITCAVRIVPAPDRTNIPIPVGGLGLQDGSSVIISNTAQVQINISDDGRFYVVVNNSPSRESEASELFRELSLETAIERLETLATNAFKNVPGVVFKAAGLLAGVIASLLTSSTLTREVFIRCDLDTGTATDGPPVTYCLLL